MSDNSCKHDWSYQDQLLLSYPPCRRRICRRCGKKELHSHDLGPPNDYAEQVEKFALSNPEEEA